MAEDSNQLKMTSILMQLEFKYIMPKILQTVIFEAHGPIWPNLFWTQNQAVILIYLLILIAFLIELRETLWWQYCLK